MSAQSDQPCPAPKPDKPTELHESSNKDWDQVDEAVWESFPASDAPAHCADFDEKLRESRLKRASDVEQKGRAEREPEPQAEESANTPDE